MFGANVVEVFPNDLVVTLVIADIPEAGCWVWHRLNLAVFA